MHALGMATPEIIQQDLEIVSGGVANNRQGPFK